MRKSQSVIDYTWVIRGFLLLAVTLCQAQQAKQTYIATVGGGSGGGGVSNIGTGCGLSGGAITATGTIVQTVVTVAHNGTYTILTGDCSKVLTTNTTASWTLPQAGSAGFSAGWYSILQNVGSGTLTVTTSTSTVYGSGTSGSSFTVAAGAGAEIVSDGTNWNVLSIGSAGGASGSAGGDLTGTYPSPTVSKINGVALSGLATGPLCNTTSTGVPAACTPSYISLFDKTISPACVGNLVTDDTACIVAALATGKDVLVPDNTAGFKITSAISLNSNQTLFGNGNLSIIKRFGTSYSAIQALSGRSNVHIRNFALQGDAAATDNVGIGINLISCTDCSVENMTVTGQYAESILASTSPRVLFQLNTVSAGYKHCYAATTGSDDMNILNNRCLNMLPGGVAGAGNGFVIGYTGGTTSNAHVMGNYTNTPNNYCYQMQNLAKAVVSNNRCYSAVALLASDTVTTSEISNNSGYNLLTNSSFDSAMYLNSTTNSLIKENYIDTVTGATFGNGIRVISGSTGNTLQGNVVRSCLRDGFYINANDTKVYNNQATGCALWGIELYGSLRADVAGNVLADNTLGGILLNNSPTGSNVYRNDISNVAAAGSNPPGIKLDNTTTTANVNTNSIHDIGSGTRILNQSTSTPVQNQIGYVLDDGPRSFQVVTSLPATCDAGTYVSLLSGGVYTLERCDVGGASWTAISGTGSTSTNTVIANCDATGVSNAAPCLRTAIGTVASGGTLVLQTGTYKISTTTSFTGVNCGLVFALPIAVIGNGVTFESLSLGASDSVFCIWDAGEAMISGIAIKAINAAHRGDSTLTLTAAGNDSFFSVGSYVLLENNGGSDLSHQAYNKVISKPSSGVLGLAWPLAKDFTNTPTAGVGNATAYLGSHFVFQDFSMNLGVTQAALGDDIIDLQWNNIWITTNTAASTQEPFQFNHILGNKFLGGGITMYGAVAVNTVAASTDVLVDGMEIHMVAKSDGTKLPDGSNCFGFGEGDERVRIVNNICTTSGNSAAATSAIDLSDSYDMVVANNTFSCGPSTGYCILTNNGAGGATNPTFIGNTVTAGSAGIKSQATDRATITGNAITITSGDAAMDILSPDVITGNNIQGVTGTQGNYMVITEGTGGAQMTFTGNTVAAKTAATGFNAVLVADPGSVVSTGPVVSGNTFINWTTPFAVQSTTNTPAPDVCGNSVIIAGYNCGILFGTTSSIGGGLLTVGTCSSGTATIAGVTTGMSIAVTPVSYPGDGSYWYGYRSSSNTVTVKVCAVATLTPSATAYNIRVVQ